MREWLTLLTGIVATIERRMMVRRKFVNGPDKNMMNFLQGLMAKKEPLPAEFIFLLLFDRATERSSDPPSLQYPPKGIKERRNSVFFPQCLQRTGPIPMPKTSTSAPRILAAIKCPNSWIINTRPVANNPIRRYKR